MERTIGIGVIGMGWMGEAHSRAYDQLRDRFFDAPFRPRLVICADAVEERAQQGQARFGFARSTTDWREVVADPEVEVVDVTAPNGMHLEINLRGRRGGQAPGLREARGAIPVRDHRQLGGGEGPRPADVGRVQLSLGADGAGGASSHRGRRAGHHHALPRPLPQWLCR